MRFDIVTIFPEFFAGPLDYGIVRRARESSLIDVHVQDLREFTHDRHRTVDDRPFGGGEGMVLKPEPLFEAVEALLGQPAPHAPAACEPASAAAIATIPNSTSVICLSASGRLFRQSDARRLAGLERIILLCGRYEGVDERVAQHLATEELSIGDFVLSGGELAAALVIDAVTRLLPGALGNEASSLHESFSESEHTAPQDTAQKKLPGEDSRALGAAPSSPSARNAEPLLLDFPHYTRPADFRGWTVPEVLLGGNHEEIRRWRQRMALEKTRRNRPDLLRGSTSVSGSE
jgi:tRNA (guanine37-N1)-methyltransferase